MYRRQKKTGSLLALDEMTITKIYSMDNTEFKKLLFKVAFCTMACDGDIDSREIDEIKSMEKNTSFFQSVDLSNELDELIKVLNSKGRKIIEDLFNELSNCKLNTIQELIVLEVALRITNADKRIDENEIKFVNLLRSKLKIHDETIRDRFGIVEILYTNDYSHNISNENAGKDFVDNIILPELTQIKDIDLGKK